MSDDLNVWIDVSFRLPRDENLPVVVRYADGKEKTVRKLEGDWRQVVAWKKLKTEAQ